MTLQNTGLTFSESLSLPLLINAPSTPGTLVHKSSSEADDYVWIWASNTGELAAEIRLYKGESILGYTLDCSIIIPPKSGKVLIEPGILITGGVEIRGYVVISSNNVRQPVYFSGHVHRRVD